MSALRLSSAALSPEVLAEFSHMAFADGAYSHDQHIFSEYQAFLNDIKSVNAKDRTALHKSIIRCAGWLSKWMDLMEFARYKGSDEQTKIIKNEIRFLSNLMESLNRKYKNALFM